MGIAAAISYLVLYALSIAFLATTPEFNTGESLAVFLIFGVGFSIVAWLATIGVRPEAIEVRRQGREFLAVILYLTIFALFVLGWGFSAVRSSV